MYAEVLIKNHFNLEIDNQNVYFKSLLVDDFDYLKDAPIQRYNWGKPCYSLWQMVESCERKPSNR